MIFQLKPNERKQYDRNNSSISIRSMTLRQLRNSKMSIGNFRLKIQDV